MRRNLSAVSGKRKRKSPARKTTHRRRRRISGIGSLDIKGIGMKIAGLGVGSIGARELNTILVKRVPSISPAISGAIQIVIGVVLPKLAGGSKFIADVGDGMIANGVMVGAVALGVISGMNNGSRMSYRVSGGPNNMRAIAGTMSDGLRTIAGKGDLNAVAGMQRRKMVSGCF